VAEQVVTVGEHGIGRGAGDGVEVLDLGKGVVDVDDRQQMGQGSTLFGPKGA
jgi:hypothetical protein